MDAFKRWALHELEDYIECATQPVMSTGHVAAVNHYRTARARKDNHAAARFLFPLKVADPALTPFGSVMVWLTSAVEKLCNMYQGHFMLILGLLMVTEANRREYVNASR